MTGPRLFVLAEDAPSHRGCVPAGVGGQGVACEAVNCSEGFACVDPGDGQPICAALCDRMDGTPGCDGGLSCDELSGHVRTGVCLP